ncbi:MAG: sulfotransferase, partial [Pseudomonadota bacterium]|nr:sulfotransferase [Pseudomonadota bacterium]
SRYMLQGYKGQPHFGESSTHYTLGGLSRTQKIPQRIAQMNPDMKFVYMLRDPIHRIRSNYLHSARLGLFTGTLEQYLDGKRGKVAVRTSLYFHQLSEYLSVFPADRFHVVIFEEFVKSPSLHMAEICRFLGVDAMPGRLKYDAHNVSHNRGQATVSNHLECSPERLAALKLRVGADTRKLCDWLGRSEISEWDLTV